MHLRWPLFSESSTDTVASGQREMRLWADSTNLPLTGKHDYHYSERDSESKDVDVIITIEANRRSLKCWQRALAMPNLKENQAAWDGAYDWHDAGDEWSTAWGGPSMQWYGSILPRIQRFVPTTTILEIACGYGRWTQFLHDLCDKLIVIDLSENCIQACRQRFADSSRISYYVNDGTSLAMIGDESVDFAFSFDSLVHADELVVKAYITQLARILKPGGAAFIHHSNLGDYPQYSIMERFPRLRRLLSLVGLLEKKSHWRDFSVTARKVARYAEASGSRCVSQELVTWDTRRALIDCMSTIVRKDSPLSRANRVLKNRSFTREMRYLSRLAPLYGPGDGAHRGLPQ